MTKIILYFLLLWPPIYFLLLWLPLAAKASAPPRIEAVVHSSRLMYTLLPGVAGAEWYHVEAISKDGDTYTLLLPGEAKPRAGQNITIVQDEVRYVVYNQAEYFDYMGMYKRKVKANE